MGARQLPGPVAVGARVVVVLVPDPPSMAPPGIDPARWTRALLEDTCEVAAGLSGVDTVLAGDPSGLAEHADLVWPGTPSVVLLDPVSPLGELSVALAGAAALVVLPADVPDIPGLLLGKLFRDLGGADLAVCPSTDGGLAALGVRLPPADWVRYADPGPDSEVSVFAAAAPAPSAFRTVVGWHRLRRPVDVAHLDPGLEGWDSTRALLSGHPIA